MLQRPWRRRGDDIKIDLTSNACIMFVLGGGYVPTGFVWTRSNFSFEGVHFLDQASDLTFK